MVKIGKVILELRKQKRITQEELGNAVGVTTQAVSKWENGGTPDAELLPAIADYFHVSVDYLFGRTTIKETSLEEYVYQEIHKLPSEEKNEGVYKVLHSLLLAGTTIDEASAVLESLELKLYDQVSTKFGYVMINDTSLSYLSLRKKNPYYVFFPEPEAGYESMFAPLEDYREAFAFLGEEYVLEILIELYRFSFMKGCTADLISRHSKIEEHKVTAILQKMVKYQWVQSIEVETENGMMNVYLSLQTAPIVPFLILAEEMIRPGILGYCLIDRERPIFDHKYQRDDKLKK